MDEHRAWNGAHPGERTVEVRRLAHAGAMMLEGLASAIEAVEDAPPLGWNRREAASADRREAREDKEKEKSGLVMRVATSAARVGAGIEVLAGAPPGRVHRRTRRRLRHLHGALENLRGDLRLRSLRESTQDAIGDLFDELDVRLDRALSGMPEARHIRRLGRWVRRFRDRLKAALDQGAVHP